MENFYFLSVIFIVETQRKSTAYNGGENKKIGIVFFYIPSSLVDQRNLFTSFIYLLLFVINDLCNIRVHSNLGKYIQWCNQW